MFVHRFYVAQNITGETVAIGDSDQLHHLKDVLRLGHGDEVVLFDSEGNECTAVVAGMERERVVFQVKARKPARVTRIKTTIGCAIPKNVKMDDIIDKLTQLGVDRIIPLETGRVVVKLDANKREERLKRWKAIALSAAQQSQRSSIPRVEPVTGLRELLSSCGPSDLKLVPTLFGSRKSLVEVLAGSQADTVVVLIGPEGDFSPEEVGLAVEAGFIPVSLGNSVLKVDTAAIAVASYIHFCLG